MGQKQIKNIKSWEECAYLCKLDDKCKGWSWAGPDFVEATIIYTCALKPKLVVGTDEKGGGPESKKKGVVRGTKECGECMLIKIMCYVHLYVCYFSDVSTTLPPTTATPTLPPKNETCQQNDTHHKGDPLKSIEDIESWQQCAHLCFETKGCTHWSYFTESFVLGSMVGRCDLQSTDKGNREAVGVVSGTAECGECRVEFIRI